MCVCVLVDGCISQFSSKLSVEIEHVNSDCAETDDGSLALAFLSLRFLYASFQLHRLSLNNQQIATH